MRGGPRNWRPFVAAPFAALFVARAANAEDLPISLALHGCDELNETAVRRITAAELGAAPSVPGPEVTEVTVTCDVTRVTLRVKDPISRKAVQRSFDMGLSDPRARERLVSLAATELVLASWAELRVNPEPRVEPEGPRPTPRKKLAAKRSIEGFFETEHYEPEYRPWYAVEAPTQRHFRILAEGSIRTFFAQPATLVGGGVRIGEERFRFASWAADVLFENGRAVTNRNLSYDIQTLTFGAMLLAYVRTGKLTAGIGGGLRAGLVSSSAATAGSPSGSVAFAPWGWPLGVASVSIALAGPVVLDVSAEVGYVVLPVPNPTDPGIRSGWFGAQVGLGLMP